MKPESNGHTPPRGDPTDPLGIVEVDPMIWTKVGPSAKWVGP